MPSFVPQPFGEPTPTPAAPAAPPLVMAPAQPPLPAMAPPVPALPLQATMPPTIPGAPGVMPPPVPKFAAVAPQPYAPAFIPGAPRTPPVLPPAQRRAVGGDRFGVQWWALLVAAPMVVVQFAAAQSIAESRDMSGGKGVFLATSVLWPAVFATVAAFGLWWVCGRSRKFATIAFLVVYAGFTLPDMLKLAGGPSKSLASTAPQRVFVPDVTEKPERIPPTTFSPLSTSSGSRDPSASSDGSSVESGGMKIVARPGVRRTVVAPDPATLAPPKPTGPRIPTFKEAVAKATGTINDAQAKTAAPTQRWTSLGGSDLSGVKSEQDLADRMEALDDLASAIRGARDAADGARDQLRKDLAAAKLPIAMRDNQVAVWASDQRIEDERQVAYAAEKYVAAWRSQLVTLQREWGRWWVDGQGRVGFKNQQTGKTYERGASDVEAARKQLSRAIGKSRSSLLSGNASVLAGK